MASPRSHRRIMEAKNHRKKATLSLSFNGDITSGCSTSELYQRPRTVPDLFSGQVTAAGNSPEFQVKPKLTKLLLNVTVQRSLGAVHVLISPESTVHDLIAAAIRLYTKEERRPVLCSSESSDYDLHYSQFSLESLDRTEKLTALGTRNFFLCPKKVGGEILVDGGLMTASSRCTKQADADICIAMPWPKFMDFLL